MKRDKMLILNWMEKIEDETITGNTALRKLRQHLDNTRNEINFGRNLLNEQDPYSAYPNPNFNPNKNKNKNKEEDSLLNRRLNLINYRKLHLPNVIYAQHKNDENSSNYITNNLAMKNILKQIDELQNKKNITIKHAKIYPRYIRRPKRNLPPIINLSPSRNEEKKNTPISSLFKNTCLNYENEDKSEKKFTSSILNKNLDNVFKTIDDETSRSIELSEIIREGIMEANKIKKNDICFSVDRKDRRKITKDDDFDEKNIKKYPIISKFNDIGKIRKIKQIEEVLYNKKNLKI